MQDEKRNIQVLGFGVPYIRDFTVFALFQILPILLNPDGGLTNVSVNLRQELCNDPNQIESIFTLPTQAATRNLSNALCNTTQEEFTTLVVDVAQNLDAETALEQVSMPGT